MKKRFFRIADLTISIAYPEELVLPENLFLFEIEEEEISEINHIYQLEFLKLSPEPEQSARLKEIEQLLDRWADAQRFERHNLVVYVRDSLECRWIYFEGARIPYAICEERSASETHVYLMEQEKELFQFDSIFTSVLSPERHLIRRAAMIFHCAYMVLNGEAILFSAPSGTGKSTQAELWEKYRGTRQINGDDAVLNQQEGRWFANGFQVCGSSEICYNESYPIRAIVMLYQAQENTCRRLSPFEAFRKIYAQVKVNMWNADFQDRVLDLLNRLVTEVPVLELGCTISEDAVACLEQALTML